MLVYDINFDKVMCLYVDYLFIFFNKIGVEHDK